MCGSFGAPFERRCSSRARSRSWVDSLFRLGHNPVMLLKGRRTSLIVGMGAIVVTFGAVLLMARAWYERDRMTKELKELAQAATDSNWERSQDALKALGRQGPKASLILPELLEQYLKSPTYPVGDVITAIGAPAAAFLARRLENPDEEKLVMIVTILRDMGPTSKVAVPTLASLLKRTERGTRAAILEALAAIGPGSNEALSAILETLEDEDPWVHEQAKDALAVLGSAAIPALTERLASKDPKWRGRATECLEMMGPGAWRAALALQEALHDEVPAVRIQAARALFAIEENPEQAVAVIIEALHSQTEAVLWSVIEWLDYVGPRGAAVVPALIPFLEASSSAPQRNTILRTLGKVGPGAKAAIPYLVAATAKDPKDLEAAMALWLIDQRIDALRLVLNKLESNDDPTGGSAAFFLQLMRPLSVEALPKLLEPLSRREQLHIVIPCLSDLGPAAKEAEPDLLLLLRPPSGNVPTPGVHVLKVSKRLEAAHALWRIGGDLQSAIPFLLNILGSKGLWDYGDRARFGAPALFSGQAGGATPWDVRRAASILGEIGQPARAAVPILREALDAPDTSIRHSAAEALWKIEGNADATVAEILKVLAAQTPPFSRDCNFGLSPEAVMQREDALVEAGARAVPLLIAALQQPEPQVRAAVARALGAIGPAASQSIPALAYAARDTDIRVANAAIRALRKMGPEGRVALDRALPSSEILPPRKRR
jgi:HEAT repeat protein